MILLRDGRDAYDGIFGDGNGQQNTVIPSRGDPQVAFHPVGRNAFLIRSVKSAFALLLTKVTKPRR